MLQYSPKEMYNKDTENHLVSKSYNYLPRSLLEFLFHLSNYAGRISPIHCYSEINQPFPLQQKEFLLLLTVDLFSFLGKMLNRREFKPL